MLPTSKATTTPLSGPFFLLARWNFEEGSGNIILDSSGHNFNGNSVNYVSWSQSSRIGQYALLLDATRLQNVNLPLLPYLRETSLLIWVQTTSKLDIMPLIFLDGNLVLEELELFRGIPRYKAIVNGTSFILQNNINPQDVADGFWHHIAITRSGSYVAIYIDGILEADGTATLNFPMSSDYINDYYQNNKIAADNSNQYYDGLLDDARIYGVALTESQILLLCSKFYNNTGL